MVDVVSLMIMKGVVRDGGRDVRALVSRRRHGGVHAINVRCNPIDVPLHDLLGNELPVGGLHLSPG